MRKCCYVIVAAMIAISQVGCGTLHNLSAPPPSQAQPGVPLGTGAGACVPFGGVARSALLGLGTPTAMIAVLNSEGKVIRGAGDDEALRQIGGGLMLAGAGLIAIADTPVSLVGDILTLPIAYARHQEYPWATWWGSAHGVCPVSAILRATTRTDLWNQTEGENEP